MAKKPRSSAKGEPLSSAGADTGEPGTELNIPVPKGGGMFDFYLVFGGIGVIATVAMIIYLLNQFIFHIR